MVQIIFNRKKSKSKIGKAISTPIILTSGVPQGGILSPIVFTIYGADLEDWVKHSKVVNYADDTTTFLRSISLLL